MTKCPQCLKVLSKKVGLCDKCGYLFAVDLDETQATKILEDKTMTPEKWEKVKELFLAVEKIAPDRREKFLDRACVDDTELRREVENLLYSQKEGDSFLDNTAVGEASSLFDEKTISDPNETQTQIYTTISSGEGKLVEGNILAERYRILGLLGKGGMGEVYKAEDIKLDQTVALKFLPEKLAGDQEALRRFVGEVKNARQVSHENICRVFDIGEIDGKQFISMEFIDGDDLSVLLRRIGRLPSERAVEISRQICLGLNAIHKAGILHRDLKPANVIIDSNGLAKITDFGIAGFEADVQGREARVGTPAYMSPEQITGREVSQQSDIYSLGLLLYEIFTGKQAVQGKTLGEIFEKHQSTNPTDPSEFVESIDPLVEKIIESCLEKNPLKRPATAVQVAMALPGGNPLEVAIAAGETPTPEMIAASPSKGLLKPLVALGLLLGFIGGFTLLMYWTSIYGISASVPLEGSPEMLARKAQTIIKNLGYTEPPIDRHYRFYGGLSYLRFANKQKNPRQTWEKVQNGQPLVYYFRYRQSPKYLSPTNFSHHIFEDDPPLNEPGMINVELDTKGRLIKFTAVPEVEVKKTEQKIEWKKLFDEAGLDIGKFEEIESSQRPTVVADEIIGWKGTLADDTDIPVRIEAAGYQGKPVYFSVIPTWKESTNIARQKVEEESENPIGIVFLSLLFLALFGAFLLARYNLKNGRSDLKGATKVAALVFVALFFGELLNIYIDTSAPGFLNKVELFFEVGADSLGWAFLFFVAYLAIEPYFRRRLSDLFISWNRLLQGDFRNPMIGRDILVGLFLATVAYIVEAGLRIIKSNVQPRWINDYFFSDATIFLNGITKSMIFFPFSFTKSIQFVCWFMFFILIFSLIFKKSWKSVLAAVILFGCLDTLNFTLQQEWLDAISRIFFWTVGYFVVYRYGIVAMLSWGFVGEFVQIGMATFDTTSFYFPTTVMIMVVLFALAIYSYYISTAGQSIFESNVLKNIEVN